MNLRKIIDDRTDPRSNIAIEHALHHIAAETKKAAILRFWRNTPSVIIGRVQDIHQEVNLEFCNSNNIEVLRRISGGGTVFHDLGNLNTTIILPISRFKEKNVQTMSKELAKLMTDTLVQLGIVPVYQEGDTNIFYKEKKISGSAGHLRKGWFLHHATLLFDTNIDMLNQSILARESNPEDPKKSRYFQTTNIDQITREDWIDAFTKKIANTYSLEITDSQLSDDEVEYARKLERELYSKDAWNFQGKRKLIRP